MESTVSSALILLGVGMITVFTILALVVLSGNVLIRIVNRISTEEEAIVVSKIKKKTAQSLNPKKLAAIIAAVEIMTDGKGYIEQIQKSK